MHAIWNTGSRATSAWQAVYNPAELWFICSPSSQVVQGRELLMSAEALLADDPMLAATVPWRLGAHYPTSPCYGFRTVPVVNLAAIRTA